MNREKSKTEAPVHERLWHGLQDSARIKKWLSRIPALLSIVFVLLLAHSAAVLTWKLVPQPVLPRPAAPTPRPAAAVSVPGHRYDAAQISSWALMGRYSTAITRPAAPAVVTAKLKETSLNIKLIGIIYSRHADESRAVILGGPKDPKARNLYRTGDRVAPGAWIETILRDRIILMHNNERVSLKLRSVKEMERLLKKYSNKNSKLKK